MMQIPKVTNADVTFGNIRHMPKFDTLPVEFQRMSHPACRAVSMWFFKGGTPTPGGITLDGRAYAAKSGVDVNEAMAAIRAVLCSFQPKHEHKIAGCGFMLNEWFDTKA